MSRDDFKRGAGAAPAADVEAAPNSDVDTAALIPQVNARRDLDWRPQNVTSSASASAALKRRQISLEIFAQPDWTLHQALAWICYRDPERMCDLSEGAHRRLVLYGAKRGNEVDANCAEALRCVLVEGQLTAFRNGEAVPAAYWMGRSPSWPDWADFCCLKTDLLRLMPQKDRHEKTAATKRLSDAEIETLIEARTIEKGVRPTVRDWRGWAEMVDGGVRRAKFEEILRRLGGRPPGRPKSRNVPK